MKYYPVAEPQISDLEKTYVNQCLDSGWISSQGEFIQRFESAYADYCGTKHAISVVNGTMSLHAILLALGIGAGDEVIVPAFTYVASANVILYTGAKPIFVDCDPETYNIDTQKVMEKITSKTRAIIAVHIYGNPCDMDELQKISKQHNLHLIEDAAESHGAKYKNQYTGSMGIANSFSFFGNKTITTGEGGMITLNNDSLAAGVLLLKNQGQHPSDQKYFHRIMGYNYRMTNIQAAIGLAQLEQLDKFVSKKRLIHTWYKKYLEADLVAGLIKIQKDTEQSEPSYWMNAFTLEQAEAKQVANKLSAEGIDTRPFFIPMPHLPYLKNDDDYPNSTNLHQKGIILPGSTNLEEQDVELISEKLSQAIK
jgi:perosamine synthetase